MIITLKPGNIYSSLNVYPSNKKRGISPPSSTVERKKVDYKGRLYASYKNSKLRNARILAWNGIKNQPVVHLSIILSAFRFTVDAQLGDADSFKYELKVLQRRLRKIKTLFRATFKDCYLLNVVEISNLDIIHVHLLSNIALDQVGLFVAGIIQILGSVVEDYEAKARGHKAIYSAPFVPAQIPYLAAPKKMRETARILAIMGGKHSMGVINEKAVVYHESSVISATSEQLESIKRYISFIIQENKRMSSANSLNNHQALNIANNHFTQHAMTSGQVEEVLARSEEVLEGHYDNRSLFAIQIREVLGPDLSMHDTEDDKAAKRAAALKAMEFNFSMTDLECMEAENPNHPGEILRDHLAGDLGIDLRWLAQKFDTSTEYIEKLFAGTAPITGDVAKRISEMLATTPEFWLSLQEEFDCWASKYQEKQEECRQRFEDLKN